MGLSELLQSYELLADRADDAFAEMARTHGEAILCRRHCSDCCHAVFGLFLIEAAYVHGHFHRLDQDVKKAALLRCNEMERGLRRLEKKVQVHEQDPQMQHYILARERIRCPLLDDNQECVLYRHRPITCRVYGIPTRIQGKARVCGRSGFKRGESYPAFDLDGVYRSLHGLSVELLQVNGKEDDLDRASLLISVSKIMTTPLESLIRGDLE
ncbi:MAG: YkgJ family cysteine cluster protein [Deltaproteobacteria bacterium]|nr:YkgJ family cysteine cluster protein [Deltaproteobacteria bacterium]